MAKLYVVKTGQTYWEQQQRLESTVGAPLTDQGARDVQDVARQLVGLNISAMYAAKGEPEHHSAKLLAKMLGLKVRTNSDLRELDYGLWQGLTVAEIKRRQPKVYRQWTENPASIRPPEGETLADAQKRLSRAMKQISRRHKGQDVLLVLRPVALAVLHCLLSDETIDAIWRYVNADFTWASYEIPLKTN